MNPDDNSSCASMNSKKICVEMDAHQQEFDESETSISDLPEEVLMKIFSLYIDAEGRGRFLKNVMPVCMEWKRISSSRTFWKHIDSTLSPHELSALCRAGLLTYTKHLCLTRLSNCFTCITDVKTVYAFIVMIISGCEDLKSLDLSSHVVSRKLFSFIAKSCPNLEDLVLKHARGFGVHFMYWKLKRMQPLFRCCSHSLKSINLDHCKLIFSDGDLESIADSCHSLEEFHFYFSYDSYCVSNVPQKFPVFPVAKFQTGCHNLRVLKVGTCYFDCSGVEETNGFPNLIMFGARGSRFRENDLLLILGTSTELTTLELCYCPYGETFCNNLLQLPCHKVSRLILGRMPIYLRRVLSQWISTLRHLEITGFNVNVGRVLYRVLHNNPKSVLKSLDLSGSYISLENLKFVVNQCPKLKNLELERPVSYSKCQPQTFMHYLPEGFPKFFHSREELLKILEY